MDIRLEYARIGDVLLVESDADVPADWHELDGASLLTYSFPKYAEAMGIRTARFVLPATTPREGWKHVVRLGPYREPPLPRPAVQAGRRVGDR